MLKYNLDADAAMRTLEVFLCPACFIRFKQMREAANYASFRCEHEGIVIFQTSEAIDVHPLAKGRFWQRMQTGEKAKEKMSSANRTETP